MAIAPADLTKTKSSSRRLDPLDLYDVRGLLSEDEQMVKDSVGRMVDEKVLPIIQHHFENHTFPRELVGELAGLGLFGSSLEGYGCAGMNAVSYGLICQELERGDSGLRSFVSVQSSLCMYPIYTYGSEEQKQKYLPRMATGEVIGCFGLTEPHGGSDPANMKTHAKRRGNDWVINGAKMWITNSPIADLFVIWAKTEEGIRGFLVEKGAAGLAAPEIEKKFSLRASITGAIFLEDVVVPGENMLPGSVCGIKAPLSCLTQARYGITWGVIGAAQLFLGAAVIEALVAVWALNRFSGIRRIYQARASSAEPVPFSSLLTRPLIGAFLLAFAGQFQTGLFSGIWSIYLADRGASDLAIGLSYSTYSIAFMVLAPFGGRLADRTPRWRKLLVANLLFSLVVASYGVLPSVTLVILMGLAEGAIGAVAQPTLDAYLASVADARVQGRVQGAFATTGMAGAAISAFLGSVLYALGAPVPFAVGGTVLALLTLVAAALIREAEQRRAGGPPGHDQPTQVLAEPGAGYSA
mgnify:CR=1 FL=1